MQKILITLGIVLLVAGLLWPFLTKIGLGRLPGDIAIRRESDAGTPTAAGDGPQAEAFANLARSVADWVDSR